MAETPYTWTTEGLIGFLPPALALEDESRDALVGLLEPVAQVCTLLERQREHLPDLLDPDEVPDDQVAYLAAIVGVGPDTLPAADRLDTDQLRRLLAGAVYLWKRKGTSDSWRLVVATFTGSRALILGWFYYRTIEGSPAMVHTIPAGSTAPGGSLYDYPEHVTDVWFMDPDGGADLDALSRWLDVVRPSSERINARQALLVDDLAAAASLWTAVGSGSFAYDEDARELTAGPSLDYVAAVDGASAWASYHAMLRLALTGATTRAWLYADAALANGYRLTIDLVAGTVSLHRVVASVATLLVTYTFPTVVPTAGTAYRWSFEAVTGVTLVTVRCYFEGLLLIDYDDTDAARRTAGACGWGAGAASTATLSTALVRGITPIRDRIGPQP